MFEASPPDEVVRAVVAARSIPKTRDLACREGGYYENQDTVFPGNMSYYLRAGTIRTTCLRSRAASTCAR